MAEDRAEIAVECRSAEGRDVRVLHADATLAVPEFGLRCRVRDVYRDTPLG